jgi:hypothetical protein
VVLNADARYPQVTDKDDDDGYDGELDEPLPPETEDLK